MYDERTSEPDVEGYRWRLRRTRAHQHIDKILMRNDTPSVLGGISIPVDVWTWIVSPPPISDARARVVQSIRPETIRERAVREVDAEHGYTMEFSSSPTAHAAEYDEREQRVQQAIDTLLVSHPLVYSPKPGESYRRCPVCEQWSPCDVRVVIETLRAPPITRPTITHVRAIEDMQRRLNSLGPTYKEDPLQAHMFERAVDALENVLDILKS